MKYYQGRKKWRVIIESWPVLILLSGLVVFFAVGVAGFVGEMRTTIENKANAESVLEELKERQEKLESDLADMSTLEGKERILREDFGFVKEGESVIVVVDDKEEVVEEEKSGFFNFFKKWFK